MVLNEAISRFQQQIGAYDKERWEEHLEQKEQEGIVPNKNAPLKVGRVKTELIDVDLVRGSTFTKAKPEHAWLATTRKGLCRVLLLPVFYHWWKSQLTVWMLHLLLVLYFLQLICLLIYMFSSPAVKEHLYLMEVMCPVVAMVVIGSTYTSVVSTNARQKSMKKYSRRDLRQTLRRKRDSHRKSSSEETDRQKYCKGHSTKLQSPSQKLSRENQRTLPVDRNLSIVEKSGTLFGDQSMSNSLSQVLCSEHGRESQEVICNEMCNIACNRYEDPSHLSQGKFPTYVQNVGESDISGCSVEDFTLLNTPIEDEETVGTMYVKSDETPREDWNMALPNAGPESIPQVTDEEERRIFCDSKPSEENERYIPPKAKLEPGFRKVRRVSLLDRAQKFSPVFEEEEEGSTSDGEISPQVLVSPTKSAVSVSEADSSIDERGRAVEQDFYQADAAEDQTNARHLSSKSTESDLEETVWDETAGDESSSSTSSDTSGDEVTSEEEEVAAKHHGTGASLSHLEDPFKIFHAASSSTSVSNSGKVRVRVFEGNECKKTDMTVLEISCAINNKVHSLEGSTEYLIMGLLLSVLLALLPLTYRCYMSKPGQNITWLSGLWVWSALKALSALPAPAQFVLLVVTILRFVSSCLIFFMLCAAERTYKQRCLFAKYFAHLTSARQARKSSLPHFRLDKVSNIKAWLSLRSFLKKRGPQRSVNTIVSSAFLLFLMLISVLCMEMIRSSDNFPSNLHNWELVGWTFSLSPFLLQFIILGSEINKKFRNTSVLLTEQINLYLNMERKPHKKEELLLANNVLKLASKLLKELETPFKISGLVMNPVLYNITRVVVLSAFSGVLTELLGFKLKLWKIKT
ncbi:putative homeodomain transcription factor 2 [Holothuria leucospilota]|uniref:Homeodomain transcription factor 2 n=1 Tax=Holothuria leucospilota TaxID=206669 RepID=A0A9Q0YDS1_HOLLE|nr:putative homeodomain transcription factor 2 [Holothuria leucospilota]